MTEKPSRNLRSNQVTTPRALRGVTLVEMLIVVAILGILAGLALTYYEPGIVDQLQSAAQVVAADASYARSLAVMNNSQYRLQFDVDTDRYWLEHSGANNLLDHLPASPFQDAGDSATRRTTDLSSLPSVTGAVELAAVYRIGSAVAQSATEIEFGPLGALTQPERAVIWLGCGGGTARRFVSVEISPVTGLADIGEIQNTIPTPTSATSITP